MYQSGSSFKFEDPGGLSGTMWSDLEVYRGRVDKLLKIRALLSIYACVHECEHSDTLNFKDLVILCSCLVTSLVYLRDFNRKTQE